MSELHKRRLFALIFITVGAAIILPVVFGLPRGIAGQDGDGWRNFIYDFQTLIGGGAAVVAAWLTVRQMRITDERSEFRHRELVSLQLRADRLRVERLLYPSLNELKAKRESLSAWQVGMLSDLVRFEKRAAVFALHDLYNDVENVRAILNNSTTQSTLDLLDGRMTHTYARVVTRFIELQELAHRSFEAVKELEQLDTLQLLRNHQLTNSALSRLGPLLKARDLAIGELADYCNGLESMRKQYAIH